MKQVTPGEQAIIDELVLRRTDTFERPALDAGAPGWPASVCRSARRWPSLAADPTPTGDKVHHSA